MKGSNAHAASKLQPIVVIAATAGSFDPLRRLVAALPERCICSIFVSTDRGPTVETLPLLLAGECKIPLIFAKDDERIKPGRIYIGPPDRHLLLVPGRIRLSGRSAATDSRHSANLLFILAAEIYRDRVVGIVLAGGNRDGMAGLRTIVDLGGMALVQSPDVPSLADITAARSAGLLGTSYSLDEIATVLRGVCDGHDVPTRLKHDIM